MLDRETNRRQGEPGALSADTVTALHGVAERHGARLSLLTSREDIDTAATILAATDRTRYLTARLHSEMISELRWPGDPDPDTGIDVRSLELDPEDYAVLGILRRPDVMAHLADWRAGAALGDDTRDRVQASTGLAVVSVTGSGLADYARGGSAMEAVWVTAQQLGFAVQPVSPVFLYAHTPGGTQGAVEHVLRRAGDAPVAVPRARPDGTTNPQILVLRLAISEPASEKSAEQRDRLRFAFN